MPCDKPAPAEERLHQPEEPALQRIFCGEQPAQHLGVVERIGQVLHRDIHTVDFQQTCVQQRRDVGQFLTGRQGADIVDGHQRTAGVLLVQGGVQRDLQIAVPAGARVGLAGLAHGVHEGMHHRVGGVVA